MSLGPMQLAIIALLVLVLFGRGRISEMMGDFGKGIKSFKQGMNEDDKPAAQITPPADAATPASDSAAKETAPQNNADKS